MFRDAKMEKYQAEFIVETGSVPERNPLYTEYSLYDPVCISRNHSGIPNPR